MDKKDKKPQGKSTKTPQPRSNDGKSSAGQEPGSEHSNRSGAMEGEGNRSADRTYRKDVKEFLAHEDPSRLARQAQTDIEKDGSTYRAAEQEGKRHIAEEDPEVKRP